MPYEPRREIVGVTGVFLAGYVSSTHSPIKKWAGVPEKNQDKMKNMVEEGAGIPELRIVSKLKGGEMKSSMQLIGGLGGCVFGR